MIYKNNRINGIIKLYAITDSGDLLIIDPDHSLEISEHVHVDDCFNDSPHHYTQKIRELKITGKIMQVKRIKNKGALIKDAIKSIINDEINKLRDMLKEV